MATGGVPLNEIRSTFRLRGARYLDTADAAPLTKAGNDRRDRVPCVLQGAVDDIVDDPVDGSSDLFLQPVPNVADGFDDSAEEPLQLIERSTESGEVIPNDVRDAGTDRGWKVLPIRDSTVGDLRQEVVSQPAEALGTQSVPSWADGVVPAVRYPRAQFVPFRFRAIAKPGDCGCPDFRDLRSDIAEPCLDVLDFGRRSRR